MNNIYNHDHIALINNQLVLLRAACDNPARNKSERLHIKVKNKPFVIHTNKYDNIIINYEPGTNGKHYKFNTIPEAILFLIGAGVTYYDLSEPTL